MDKFQEMRAFVAVVDAGSFVRAADALDLSKTAIWKAGWAHACCTGPRASSR